MEDGVSKKPSVLIVGGLGMFFYHMIVMRF